jgi:hypothetical protein
MAQYPTPDPSGVRTPAFQTNPKTKITTTSQGKESHPIPPKQFSGANGPLKQAPTPVKAPGVGTI